MPQEVAGRLRAPHPTLEPLVRQLNGELRRLADAISQLQGFDGQSTTRVTPITMGRARLREVGRPQADADAVNVAYLRETAITAQPGDHYVADRPLEARGGVRVHERAREAYDLVPLVQLDEVTDGAVTAAINNLTLAGDANGPLGANTLAATGVVPGTYGDATHVPQITVDAKGRLTAATDIPITGSGGADALLDETPIGTVDGVNDTFTLTATPVTLWLMKDGLFQRPGAGNDYTLSGSTITYESTNIPVAGATHYAVYSTAATTAIFTDETPTGTIDGSNPTFTLSTTPIVLWLYKNGLFQRPGAANDYTLAGATLTFTATNVPQVGDDLVAVYTS